MLAIHEKKFDYQCSNCEKKFCVKRQLRYHMAIGNCSIENSVSKSLAKVCCETCGKEYRDIKALNFHINRIHLKIMPYKCRECDKTYFTKKELKVHILSCHRDKNFLCQDCGKCFSSDRKLKKHVR